MNTISLDGTQAGTNLPPTGDTAESPFVTSSPLTAANQEDSLVDSISPLSSDNATRPHRSRHAPKKHTELDWCDRDCFQSLKLDIKLSSFPLLTYKAKLHLLPH
ncbi:hypothetical protein QBC37DRAFT_147902 [Rhypophila decipiens]|uniref:Uncharacterized protein n=1 Tax=Rhypophila decipiens TaxID=261697 RepID=A0AAN6YAU3_9PEZI|nr:hypothetical protein QBC37DRAFT_147902 [Rhypophila decipiens]